MCRANGAMIKRTQDCRVNINIKEANSEPVMEPFIWMPENDPDGGGSGPACQKRQFILYNWTPG